MSADAVKAAVDAAFRDEWGRVVATLIRTTGDWDLAEECAQDAFAQALARWPADGLPRRPAAWNHPHRPSLGWNPITPKCHWHSPPSP